MEETKVCRECGKALPIGSFQVSRHGKVFDVCNGCIRTKRRATYAKQNAEKFGGGKTDYSDPEFDGKTPREVQDILARAAKWLNNYGGFTCEVSLRYEKEIKLDVK